MFILHWDSPQALDIENAGGKGAGLARLQRFGFAVPAGGVLTAQAYRSFAANPDLADRLASLADLSIAEVLEPPAQEQLAQVRSLMETASLPAAVAGELHAFLSDAGLLDRPVAVRSSATAEDSAAASFAGIHRTVLNVQGLSEIVRAVKACYASLWTPQAVAYRRKLGLPDSEVTMAVVILAMVDAKSAGVGFSCDPVTGRRDRFAISASFGLGESVVSGAVAPDEYLVDMSEYPPAIVRRRLGNKATAVVAREGGGTETRSLSIASGQAALTDEQVRELALLLGRVHDSVGRMERPQDVEWAHDGERFWLLQARPVTTLPPDTFPAIADQPIYWSNGNLKDILPGVQSPFGWSLLRHGMEILFASTLREAGYQYQGGMTWVRLYQGRAYFNLSALQWAFYDALGLPPGEFNQSLGGHQPEIRLPAPSLRQRAQWGFRQLRLILAGRSVLAKAPAEFERIWRWTAVEEARDLTVLSGSELTDRIMAVKSELERFLPPFQMINTMTAGTLGELIKLLGPTFGERAPAMVASLLAGAGQVTSAEHGERLIQIGNEAMGEERVAAFFQSPAYDPARWREALAGTRFAAAFEQYLADYGHRAVYELELMNPRWREDPTYLLETVRSHVLTGRVISLPDQSARRLAAEREVYGKLGRGPRRLYFRYLLEQAAKASAAREMAKSMVVKIAGVSRLHALELGRRLAADGYVETRDDVFFLSWLDLITYLNAPNTVRCLKALVTERKLLREHCQEQEAPNVIQDDQPLRKAAARPVKGEAMTGLGVSGGRAAGRARLVRHPSEGASLQMGEILVAPSTDPAWTPLFLRASGLVMEVGGYLSHGAIVAREYGIPAVVNVADALSAIADGDEVVVDGDTGKVYRAP